MVTSYSTPPTLAQSHLDKRSIIGILRALLVVVLRIIILQFKYSGDMRHYSEQRCKLLWHLATWCPADLETISRILKVNPAVFVVSRIWRLT